MSKNVKASEGKQTKALKKAEDTKVKAKSKNNNGKKETGKVKKYFKDLKSEFKKVIWPSKKKLINNTSVVLVSIVVMGIFVGLLDTGLFKLLQLIVNIGAE